MKLARVGSVTKIASQDGVVLQLQNAKTALDMARTAQEAKVVVDAAIAAEIFAKRQALGDEVEAQARSIKLEAMRKLGEFLQQSGRGDAELSRIDPATRTTAKKIASLPRDLFCALRDQRVSVASFFGALRRDRRAKAWHGKNGTGLLAMPLQDGTQFGDANYETARSAAEAFYVQAEDMTLKARLIARAAEKIKAGGIIRDRFSEQELQQMRHNTLSLIKQKA